MYQDYKDKKHSWLKGKFAFKFEVSVLSVQIYGVNACTGSVHVFLGETRITETLGGKLNNIIFI